MSLGVLLVGLGQIGMGYDLELDPDQYVQSHARAFNQHPAFHLVAAVDPDSDRRAVFTRTYRAPAYATLTAALEQHRPDIVVIATPTHLHKDTLQQILPLFSPMAVLCEKPLSYELDDARWMVEACKEKGIKLFVNYMRLADPAVAEIKRRLDAGEIAQPVKGVAWYSKGLLHNGSHFFNLMEHWLGPMQAFTLLSAGRLWDQTDPEPDVRVDFERGQLTFLAAWEEAFSHYTVELLSPSGRLRYERGGSLVEWQGTIADDPGTAHPHLVSQPDVIASEMDRYQWHVVDQLANALTDAPFRMCTGDEALGTLSALTQIIRCR